MIIKITFAIQCASIVMALIIAHEYHDAKAANAAKLANAIAEAKLPNTPMRRTTTFNAPF